MPMSFRPRTSLCAVSSVVPAHGLSPFTLALGPVYRYLSYKICNIRLSTLGYPLPTELLPTPPSILQHYGATTLALLYALVYMIHYES
jgi:hypothetical protein